MPNRPRKTLKEYAEDAAARLKKSKNGSLPLKTVNQKLSSLQKRGFSNRNTKKT